MRVCCDSQGHVAICADSNFEMEYLYNLRGSLHGDVDIHREAGFVGARTLRISPTSEQEDSPANSVGVAGGQGTTNTQSTAIAQIAARIDVLADALHDRGEIEISNGVRDLKRQLRTL